MLTKYGQPGTVNPFQLVLNTAALNTAQNWYNWLSTLVPAAGTVERQHQLDRV